ncbi:MAG: hypothetical protein IJ907_07140 [Prevotella sp.]|nr:hypothetical protein [Prevotella sp.]
MSEQQKKHHHHHHKDGASRFRDRSLNAIYLRHQAEKYLKILLVVLACLSVIAVLLVYTIG